MIPTKAIILAAGVGSRLRPLTDNLPKCLLEIGGRAIVDYQLDALTQSGIDDIVVVIGYCGHRIRQHLPQTVRYIDNVRFEDTNSLYSLWLARDELRPGAIVLNSDVLAAPALFERLLGTSAPDAVLVERGSHFEPEDMKVMLHGDLVVDFGKNLPTEHAHAHNVGVAKFSGRGAERLVGYLDALVQSGHENDWAPFAYREFATHWPLVAVATDGLPWIEIDYASDLERARQTVQPAMVALAHTLQVR